MIGPNSLVCSPVNRSMTCGNVCCINRRYRRNWVIRPSCLRNRSINCSSAIGGRTSNKLGLTRIRLNNYAFKDVILGRIRCSPGENPVKAEPRSRFYYQTPSPGKPKTITRSLQLVQPPRRMSGAIDAILTLPGSFLFFYGQPCSHMHLSNYSLRRGFNRS